MMFDWGKFNKGCAKGLLLMQNGLCIIIAISTFCFAVVDMRILVQYGDERASGTFTGDIFVITVSLLLVAVAAFGCVGAARDNLKMLYLYVGLIMIFVVLEFLVIIFVTVQRYGAEFSVADWLREDFFKNITDHHDQNVHDLVWDELQSTYECCGLNGPEDYPALHKSISTSCCLSAHRAMTEDAKLLLYQACINSAGYYLQGCEEALLYTLRSGTDWLIRVAVISFWFEASGMLLAMWMANSLKKSVEVYKQTDKY